MSTRAEGLEAILADMFLAEKIGQMTQASNESITPEDVADHHVGSVLSGGNGNPTPNTPTAWLDMVSSFTTAAAQTRLEIPLIYGVDAVHGHSSVGGATIFPHNIGLGSAGDADLVRRIGEATRLEMLATGIRWTFAPAVSVPQDLRWGRTYEGYGRDPHLVAALGAALIEGLQGPNPDRIDVLACAKHFVGDGGTSWGTAPRLEHIDWWDGWGDGWQIDQGDTRVSASELRSTHLLPYRAAIDAGVETIMASYSSWNGDKIHGHDHLLTDVLKGELGFGGFVISDWMGVDQLDPSYETSVATAINAGIDMVMVPDEYLRFIATVSDLVSSGRIPMQRIDDAVRRILRAKSALGLFDSGLDLPPLDVVGSPEHRSLAAEAVRRSAVLLKNEGVLPVTTGTVAIAGQAADDIGLQCGGWTVGWQGGTGKTTLGSTLLDGLRGAAQFDVVFSPDGEFPDDSRRDVGIVCIAEPPYAEGLGDSPSPGVTDADRQVFSRLRSRVDKLILVIYSGRPLLVADLMTQADAVVAAWLPGSEAAALGDLLTGRQEFAGRTPQPWPAAVGDLGNSGARPLFQIGHGLSTSGAMIGTQGTDQPRVDHLLNRSDRS